MQIQDVDAVRFALTVLSGHAVQFAAPAMLEYVPPVSAAPAHATHAAEPVAFL